MADRTSQPSVQPSQQPPQQTPPSTTYAAKAAQQPQQAPPNAQQDGRQSTKRKRKAAAQQKSVGPLQETAVPPAQPVAPAPAPEPAASSAPAPVLASVPNAGEWQTVTNKKAAKKTQKATKKAAAKKLRAPRSAAVILTLQPEAVERGVNYADLLKKARAAIDPSKLGITTGLRCKITQTGARLIEVPGSTSGEKADRLAEDLRALLSPEEVRVSRPQKCAELRIAGLDDSTTVEEVAAAVARVGECPQTQIRCGTIRQDRTGMGATIVSCPVATAKKLADGRRLLVGWVSAQVKLLESRPQRCYRCLSSGHVGAKCTAEVNCSGRCYRCGQPGHTAGKCELPPHCILCAAAKKPADHRAGSKACAAPKTTSSSKSRPSAHNKVAAPAAEGAELTPTQ